MARRGLTVKGDLAIKSHNPLTMWLRAITWQFKNIISPPEQLMRCSH